MPQVNSVIQHRVIKCNRIFIETTNNFTYQYSHSNHQSIITGQGNQTHLSVYKQGFRFFSRLVGRSKKMVDHFWKDGPKYIKQHSWHLDSTLCLYTATVTCIHICMLTADYTVKPVLSGHLKKKTNYRLMQVKSIAECSKGSILQSFWPSLNYHLIFRSLFYLFLSGCLRHFY